MSGGATSLVARFTNIARWLRYFRHHTNIFYGYLLNLLKNLGRTLY